MATPLTMPQSPYSNSQGLQRWTHVPEGKTKARKGKSNMRPRLALPLVPRDNRVMGREEFGVSLIWGLVLAPLTTPRVTVGSGSPLSGPQFSPPENGHHGPCSASFTRPWAGWSS